jgi:hypothetical protein
MNIRSLKKNFDDFIEYLTTINLSFSVIDGHQFIFFDQKLGLMIVLVILFISLGIALLQNPGNIG